MDTGPHQGHGIHMESMEYGNMFHPKCSDIQHQQLGFILGSISLAFAFFWSQASDASLRSSGTTATSPCWASTKGDDGPLENHQEFPSPVWLSEGMVENVWLKVETPAVLVPWFNRNILSRPSTNPVTILMNSDIGKNQKLDRVLNNSNFYKFLYAPDW